MKKKIDHTFNYIKISTIKNIFFCLFFFNIPFIALPQASSFRIDTLSSGDFDKDSLKSAEYFEEGRQAYLKEDYKLALDYFEKCLSIRKRIYPENHNFIAFAENRVGVSLKELGRLNEAIRYYNNALRIITLNYGKGNYRNGQYLNNLGNAYQQKGNFIDAIEYYEEAIPLLFTGIIESPSNLENYIKARYNFALTLYNLGRLDEALSIAIETYRDAPPQHKASFLNLIGNIQNKFKSYEKAEDSYELSIKVLNTNTENYQDSSNLSDLYIGFSTFLIERSEYNRATENLEKAKSILSNISSGRGISSLYYTYGELYYKKPIDANSIESFSKTKKDNLIVALDYYQKAIIALTDSFKINDPAVNPSIDQCLFKAQLLKILHRKAETFYELYLVPNDNNQNKQSILESALSASQLASDLLNNLRTGTVSEESKIVMTQLQNSSYLFTIKLAFELYKIANDNKYFEIAFQNSERNKAASLLDNLAEESARKNTLIPDSITQKKEDIDVQISVLTQTIFDTQQKTAENQKELIDLGQQLFQLRREKDEIEGFLEANFSDYYNLKYAEDKVALADLHKHIAKDEVIIEYVFDRNRISNKSENLYILLATKTATDFRKIPIDSMFFNDIDHVYRFLSAADFINIRLEDYRKYIISANNLYKILIQPFSNQILDRSITIIPDGKLNYIPFDALLATVPASVEKLDFKNLDYLVNRYLFNYSFSTNLYFGKYKAKKTAKHKLIAFAPVYGSIRNNNDEEYNRLAPLSGITEEVNTVSKYIKSKTFLGSTATESNFMKRYQDFDILHLAMHAIINDSLPMFSKLAFSPEADSTSASDGWLTTSEIYNLQLNSRLSVLSACNTGSGTLLDGEGVISLARGFLYAGCPSIVMTLWEVEDRSGAEIMGEFYRLLRAGKRTNQALRLSKLKHIESASPVTAHPHVWLNYVTIGKTDALYKGNDLYFFVIILIMLIGIIADQVIKMKKARKNQA